MTDHFRAIYAEHAAEYDALIDREDFEGNILRALRDMCVLDGAQVVELGAGTGRLTRLLAPHVAHIAAFDASLHMLRQAHRRLEAMDLSNWSVEVAHNDALPVEDQTADIVIEGWSIGHITGWYPDDWRRHVDNALLEMFRVAKNGGKVIVLETMGTGTTVPEAPTKELAELYAHVENHYGFANRVIRTDYRFESVEEAERLTGFFFGDALSERVKGENLVILPECTGIWWKEV